MKEALKTSKNRVNLLTDNLNDVTSELQKKQKAYNKVLKEKDGVDQENDELKRQIKRLTSGLQVTWYLIVIMSLIKMVIYINMIQFYIYLLRPAFRSLWLM